MTIKTRKEILKEWGIIKSQKDLEIFRKLQKTSTKEKELKYRRSIVKTVLELSKLKETKGPITIFAPQLEQIIPEIVEGENTSICRFSLIFRALFY